jgi:hypothetical protein
VLLVVAVVAAVAVVKLRAARWRAAGRGSGRHNWITVADLGRLALFSIGLLGLDRAAQPARHADVHGVDAQRRQPQPRHLRPARRQTSAGAVMVFLIFVVAAAEVALAIPIVLLLVRQRRTLDAGAYNDLKG